MKITSADIGKKFKARDGVESLVESEIKPGVFEVSAVRPWKDEPNCIQSYTVNDYGTVDERCDAWGTTGSDDNLDLVECIGDEAVEPLAKTEELPKFKVKDTHPVMAICDLSGIACSEVPAETRLKLLEKYIDTWMDANTHGAQKLLCGLAHGVARSIVEANAKAGRDVEIVAK